MNETQAGMLAMSGILVLLSAIMITRQGFAAWAIRNLTSGRRWAEILGEEKAIRTLRFVAGPIILLLSVLGVIAALTGHVGS